MNSLLNSGKNLKRNTNPSMNSLRKYRRKECSSAHLLRPRLPWCQNHQRHFKIRNLKIAFMSTDTEILNKTLANAFQQYTKKNSSWSSGFNIRKHVTVIHNVNRENYKCKSRSCWETLAPLPPAHRTWVVFSGRTDGPGERRSAPQHPGIPKRNFQTRVQITLHHSPSPITPPTNSLPANPGSF